MSDLILCILMPSFGSMGSAQDKRKTNKISGETARISRGRGDGVNSSIESLRP